jgi:hypothetical protein
MVKHNTKRTFSRANSDAELIEMIRRHDFLWNTWSPDGAPDDHVDEARELEYKIVATPALTRQGLLGKRRVAARTDGLLDGPHRRPDVAT